MPELFDERARVPAQSRYRSRSGSHPSHGFRIDLVMLGMRPESRACQDLSTPSSFSPLTLGLMGFAFAQPILRDANQRYGVGSVLPNTCVMPSTD
jgi:hypothetical protein